MKTVCVGVSLAAFSFDMPYTYAVPEGLDVLPGERVVVPFGSGDRRRIGIVLSQGESDGGDLKEISAVIDEEPILNAEQQELLLRIRDTTMCTYYEAFRALIPPGLGMELRFTYDLKKKPAKGQVSDRAYRLYLSAAAAENRNEADALLASDRKGTRELAEGGFVEETDITRQRIADKTITMVSLAPGYEDKKATPKQEAVIHLLEEEGTASVKEICYFTGCSAELIRRMAKNGLCELSEERQSVKKQDIAVSSSLDDVELSEEQERVFKGLCALADSGSSQCALLYGVTGSGKTLVFVKLIEYVINSGRQVILLIPEISLTPQTVERFTSLFGDKVAVMHSGLSMSRRADEYRRAKEGLCRIVIGTRSAVFAPLDRIGLIIVDEEGERTYKSGQNPRYNAKEIAAMRCGYHKGLLLFASATPSVETSYLASTGRIRSFALTKRYSGNPLPRVNIVDTAGLKNNFSDELIYEVRERLKRGEQSILLLNRRGFHTYVTCLDCRETQKCPNCSVALTYHRANHRLLCHMCGYSAPLAPVCPLCGGKTLEFTGAGTQKIEDELAEFFPNARILRMDADTTYSRCSYEKQFTAFLNGEYDIMVGTQMIAKGLDFPNVTLVGVVSVDRSLYAGDFRSYEKTFSLITQVVGRSGRADKPGMALIQTAMPDHYVIRLAGEQNYPEFYRQELATRKALIYPPFCDICVVLFTGLEDDKVQGGATEFTKRLVDGLQEHGRSMPVRIYGPAKCNVERINARYRYRTIIKCRNNREFREYLGKVRTDMAKSPCMRDVSVTVDVNGDIP